MTKNLFFGCVILVMFASCGNRDKKEISKTDTVVSAPGTFGYATDFLKKYREVIVLGVPHKSSRVLVSREDQARVITSSSHGDGGQSYGWINYELYKSKATQEHINALGGEDRFWMGPEGGQYSLFFKKGQPFNFQSWQTPAIIDSEPFDVVSVDSTQATFCKSAALENYQGFKFDIKILRQILLYNDADIEREFGIRIKDAVAFESRNAIVNIGKQSWKKGSGLISIWILGMLSPSEKTTIVIPHEKITNNVKGITDTYFGSIPDNRIFRDKNYIMLKGDGRYRGKIGVAPAIAKNVAGSYDADKHVLTLIKFDLDKNADYVKSTWEQQKNPYQGDAVNAYNDGPLTSGGQMGPFYELESSSPAKELAPGDTLRHRHITLHVEGDDATLNDISGKVLGVSLLDIQSRFK